MNIHDALLQSIAAFVYCNRHAAVVNFRVPAGACATNSAHMWGFAKIIL